MITNRAVIGMFYEMLKQDTGGSWIDEICTDLPSDQSSEEVDWLGMVPQLSAFLGEKQFAQLRETEWTIQNVKYQGGVSFPKEWILYDKTGQVRIRSGELIARARAHWYSLVMALIAGGASGTCYDGQYFFDTDHSEGDSGTQDNDITVDISALPVSVNGTTTDPSVSEFVHSVMKGVEAIMGFKDDKGEYVNEGATNFIVTVPLSLLTVAKQAGRQTSIDTGDSNIILEQDDFSIRFKASPRLSAWTTSFAVFNTDGMQKPIIRQQRTPNNSAPGFTVGGLELQTIWTDSEHYKKHDECLLSIETERAAAYGDWKKACYVTMT